jgi:hypothetical protein
MQMQMQHPAPIARMQMQHPAPIARMQEQEQEQVSIQEQEQEHVPQEREQVQVQTQLLVTLVSYCSQERGFIDAVVRNARLFSDLVIVSIGTRLYTGEAEDVHGEAARLVADADEGACEVLVVGYDVPLALLDTPVELHNMARKAGVEAARTCLRQRSGSGGSGSGSGSGSEWWALLLDGDEVPDGPAMRAWWQGSDGVGVRTDVIYKMANHWAFLHPRLVASVYEDSVVLVHSSVLLNPYCAPLSHPRERDGIYLAHAASPLGTPDLALQRCVTSGETGKPMFWHFSWVRGDPAWLLLEATSSLSSSSDGAREALKRKVRNWGHKGERDWPALIDAAFDALRIGVWPERDFVHGHALTVVPPGSSPLC